jgi:hypothetical protein
LAPRPLDATTEFPIVQPRICETQTHFDRVQLRRERAAYELCEGVRQSKFDLDVKLEIEILTAMLVHRLIEHF